MQFKINTKYIIPAIAALMLIITLKRMIFIPKQELIYDLPQPASTNFIKKIAGLGTVEPASENIGISPVIPGVVNQILVSVDDQIKAGQILFTLDSKILQSQIKTAGLIFEQAKVDLEFYRNAKSAISKQELIAKEFAVKIASSKLDELLVNLELTKVKSPIDATIQKINTHVGEYAPMAILSQPLVVLGDQSTMHVRVEIDEMDAQNLQYQRSAVGSLRSGPETAALHFVRSEGIITPKRTLVNDATERVSSRVLQVIYSFDNKELKAISGQQMDVFIELSEDAK